MSFGLRPKGTRHKKSKSKCYFQVEEIQTASSKIQNQCGLCSEALFGMHVSRKQKQTLTKLDRDSKQSQDHLRSLWIPIGDQIVLLVNLEILEASCGGIDLDYNMIHPVATERKAGQSWKQEGQWRNFGFHLFICALLVFFINLK